MTRKIDADKFSEEMMYRLSAPIITWPGYENDITIEQVQAARLARMAKPASEQCTDIEAGLYLMTSTLANPPSHTWYKIYMHVFSKAFPEQAKQLFGDSLEPLQPYEDQQLQRFRAWIFKRQIEHLKVKSKKAKPIATMPVEVTLESFATEAEKQ